MKYWLVKSEHGVYSWEQFEKEGKATWDGIRSYAARNHMKSMSKGDHVLFYHSNEGKEIVGIAIVEKEFYHDPVAGDEDWVVVDLKPFKKLNKPVTLTQVKADKQLSKIALVTIPRLSVMPLTKLEYEVIIALAN